jgi:ATP-dependent Clp protease ATP-binding subunit ClpC
MFERFTEKAIRVIMIAQEEAKRLGQEFVGTEHLLLGIISESSNTAVKSLSALGVHPEEIRDFIERSAPKKEGLFSGGVSFTPRAKRVIGFAWDEARKLGHNYVNVEHIFLGLLRESDSTGTKVLANLGVNLNNLRKMVVQLLGENLLAVERKSVAFPTPALDSFGRDLTLFAKEEKLDPVVGRNSEIQRVIQILSRRTKNNPVLTGEAGVGKTAIVEGLAQRIVHSDVPPPLIGKRIVMLDLGLLVAGTKFRGEFEERLKRVMDEIKKAESIILFIDELHTLIGAGSAEGSLDAANILKPALARGEVQCIGATTIDEYRRYIEDDAALERRFQSVLIDEPTVEETIEILKGLRSRYEEFHRVKITDQALESAARLSARYVSDRFLPDKAIDLIDEAASRVMLSAFVPKPEAKEVVAKLEEIRRQKEHAVSDQDFEKAAQLRDDELELEKKFKEFSSDKNALMDEKKKIVTEEDISIIVSSWTGIPVTQLTAAETQRLLQMEDELKKKIIGQNDAIKSLARAIRRGRAGLKDPKRPTGSFVFLGPTGVGKTASARALAAFLFGDEESLIRVDMSEFLEGHTVSKFIGSPPGYVGYDEGGQLTEQVRRKPYSVVLFDEIEKAHPDVINILLQILEDGRLTDAKGRAIDFKNTVIIMTSNVGAQMIEKETSIGFLAKEDAITNYEKMKEKITEELKKTFRPEFLNRIDDTIIFRALSKEDIRIIADLMLDEVKVRLKEHGVNMDVSTKAMNLLAEKGYDVHHGARPLRRLIQEMVEDPLAEDLLRGKFTKGSLVSAGIKGDKIIFNSRPVSEEEVKNDPNQ